MYAGKHSKPESKKTFVAKGLLGGIGYLVEKIDWVSVIMILVIMMIYAWVGYIE